MEAALGVVAVEDDAVDGNRDDLHDDFDEGADEGPILFEAHQPSCNDSGDHSEGLT